MNALLRNPVKTENCLTRTGASSACHAQSREDAGVFGRETSGSQILHVSAFGLFLQHAAEPPTTFRMNASSRRVPEDAGRTTDTWGNWPREVGYSPRYPESLELVTSLATRGQGQVESAVE
jgi:hypothetical protein